MADSLEYQMQKAGEEAYAELERQAYGDEETGDEGGGCICETCVVREILTAAWPLMLEAARKELTTTDVRVHDHYVPDKLAVDHGVEPTLINVHHLHPKAP